MSKKNTERNTDEKDKRLENLRPPWKPGESGNPNGRPPLAEIEKTAREAARREIAEVFQWLKNASDKALQTVANDPKESQIVKWMASAIINGRKSGDLSELHRMYDRLLGKKPSTEGPDGALPISGYIVIGNKELENV